MPSKKHFAKRTDWAHYLPIAALALALVLFALTQNVLFAIVTLGLLAYLFYNEFKATQNVKDLAKEIGMSIAVALGVWIVLSLLLNTTSPINIITSCSMLPGFERGDLIILQGAGTIEAPMASVPYGLANTAYEPAEITSGGQRLGQIYQPVVNGNAIFQPEFGNCARTPLDTSKAPVSQVCLKAIRVSGAQSGQNQSSTGGNANVQTMSILQSPDVVVFDSQTPAGLIIHRAFGVLNATDGAYLLTKGDNNNFLDQQSGFALISHQTAGRVLLNLPVLGVLSLNDQDGGIQWLTENQIPVKGKVLLRVPYIGYIKLLLFFQIQAPAGCDSTLAQPA